DEDDKDEKRGKKSSESSEDTEKAKASVKKAEAEMKAAQKQFQDAIRRLVEAQMALGKAGGKAGTSTFTPGSTFNFGDGKTFQFRTVPGASSEHRFEVKPGTGIMVAPRAGQKLQGGSDGEKRL